MSLSGYVTLEEAKDQLAIEHANDTHDARITLLLAAAETAACDFMNIDSLADLEDSPVQSPAVIPEAVTSAILMHLEATFNRDEKTEANLVKAFERMLWPFRQNLGV